MKADPAYVEFRNSLIQAAREHADKIAGVRPPAIPGKSNGRLHNAEWNAYADRWNFAFHSKMEEMAKLN